MRRVKLVASAGAFAAFLGPATAFALPVYDSDVDAANLTGSRSYPGGGLLQGGGSVAFSAASIAWAITDNFDGTLHYKYVLGTNSPIGFSQVVFDTSDNCTSVGSCFGNVALTGGTLGTIEFADVAAGFFGARIEIDSGAPDLTIEFDSDRIAVWSNVYASGGVPGASDFSLFNAGRGLEATDEDTGHFIPVPDSLLFPPCEDCNTHDIPEPETLPIFLAGLIGLGIFGSHRRKPV